MNEAQDRSITRLATAIAYFPGAAALAVAYFYSVGAITKIAELRGAGFSPADALPQTPIPQLLALGVSTISLKLVVIILLLSLNVAGAIWLEQRLDRLRQRIAGLDQQEGELREKQPTAAEMPDGDEARAHTDSGSITPRERLAEIDDIEADLHRISDLLDANLSKAEKMESEISETETLIRQEETKLTAAPHGLRGTLRHPLRARTRRRDDRELHANRARLARVRAEFESGKTEGPTREEIQGIFTRTAELRRSARRELRTLRVTRWASIGLIVLVSVAAILLLPPVATVTPAIMLLYFLILLRRARFEQYSQMPFVGFRPTTMIAVTIGALTLGILLGQFVSPGRLPTVVVRAATNSVSGFLVAQTDTQTTVGLPDCRIEAIPYTQIRSVTTQSRSRRYAETRRHTPP